MGLLATPRAQPFRIAGGVAQQAGRQMRSTSKMCHGLEDKNVWARHSVIIRRDTEGTPVRLGPIWRFSIELQLRQQRGRDTSGKPGDVPFITHHCSSRTSTSEGLPGLCFDYRSMCSYSLEALVFALKTSRVSFWMIKGERGSFAAAFRITTTALRRCHQQGRWC